MACERQSAEMVDIFLELGAASIEMADPHGATPLLVAVAAAASNHAFVQHLLGLGANPHAAYGNGRNALSCVLQVLSCRVVSCRCVVSCAVC
jgi:ankyrin repeat protein